MWGTGQILIGQSASVIQRYIRYIPLALVAFLAVIVQPPVPTEAASLPGIVRGTAYAGFLEVPAGSSVASIGPLFPATIGCNATPDTDTASAGSLRVGSFAQGGSLVDKVVTGRTSSSASSEATSTIQNVNVLSGLITADEIKVVASSEATATNATSSNGSTFTNLVVAGRAFSATPGPNTRVNLPGLGYVILNKQTGNLNGTNATNITVRAIEVNVTTANLALPVGARLIIGHGTLASIEPLRPMCWEGMPMGSWLGD